MLKFLDGVFLANVAVIISGIGALVSAILAYNATQMHKKTLVMQETIMKSLASKEGPRPSGRNVEEVSDNTVDGGEF